MRYVVICNFRILSSFEFIYVVVQFYPWYNLVFALVLVYGKI